MDGGCQEKNFSRRRFALEKYLNRKIRVSGICLILAGFGFSAHLGTADEVKAFEGIAKRGENAAIRREIMFRNGIPELEVTETVRKLGKILVSEDPIPTEAEIDAYHIAVAAVNGMDYLLAWNCKHIANAVTRPKIEAVCRDHGFEPPTICTPQELMEG